MTDLRDVANIGARSGLLARALLIWVAMSLCAPLAASQPVDLRTIDRTSAPNDALACPPGTCSAAADIESPVVDADADTLLERARTTLSRQPRTELTGEDPSLKQLVFVQRSRLLGFTDTVTVQAVKVGDGASLIVYSKSDVGYWDIGVNRSRVNRWLALVLDR